MIHMNNKDGQGRYISRTIELSLSLIYSIFHSSCRGQMDLHLSPRPVMPPNGAKGSSLLPQNIVIFWPA